MLTTTTFSGRPDSSPVPGSMTEAESRPVRDKHMEAISGFGFVLFLVVNATLFLRPAEVFEDLRGIEIYQYSILACLLCSVAPFLRAFRIRDLERKPIVVCVVATLLAGVVSLLAQVALDEAWAAALGGLKTLIYFFLLIGLVTTPRRLRLLILSLSLFASCAVLLAILNYHHVIKLTPAIVRAPVDGVVVPLGMDPPKDPNEPERMEGTGMFQDPNDLCCLIVLGLIFTLYGLTEKDLGFFRAIWLIPLGIYGYGFALTGSRGGFLALLAGLAVLVRLRFGLYKLVVLGVIGLPLLVAVLGGRQTEITTRTQTAQQRVQIWSAGLLIFRSAPVFGVGMHHFTESVDFVAHNSYIQTYAELGFVGGTLFLSIFYLSVYSLYRLVVPSRRWLADLRARSPDTPPPSTALEDPILARMHPYLTGGVTAWAAGMMTLSLCYLTPTYSIPGMAVAFLTMTGARPWMRWQCFDTRLVKHLVVVGFVALVVGYIAVRIMFRLT